LINILEKGTNPKNGTVLEWLMVWLGPPWEASYLWFSQFHIPIQGAKFK
jgi:hypothetical protein